MYGYSLIHKGALIEQLANIILNHGTLTTNLINTIGSFLVHAKDKTLDSNTCGVVYKVSCPKCNDTLHW